MYVRLGLFTLALATLLISIIAEAQPLQNPSPQCAEKSYAADDCLQDVAVIWLHVVKDGKIKKLAFKPQDLADMPVIAVDGYVNGIVLLSKNPLSVSVNGKPMSPIRMNADGYYKLKYYGNISRQDFWSTFLPVEKKSENSEKIQGCYSIFPKVPGDALSHAPKFQITLNQKHSSHHLTIHQDAVAKLDLRSILPAGDAPEFYYLGSNLKQFDCTSAALKQRVESLLEGIKNVERVIGRKLVQAVHIIDYDLSHNAYSCNNQNTIWLYSKLLWQESVQELSVIAEHETLHILSDQLGLSSSSMMRELFAELMDFGLFSLERFYVVSSGAHPSPKSVGKIAGKTSSLFDFINEVNFIRGMNGGHSKDNIDEFCASFLHTLMYIDQLAPLLSAPIKSQNGSLIHLSPAEQAVLLNDYERALKTVVSEINQMEMTGPLAEFLNRCQTTTLQAGMPSTTQQMADLGGHN